MYVDAQNVLTITGNFVASKQTRHIARRELIVREREIEGHLKLEKVGTDDNLADIFTKALPPHKWPAALQMLRISADGH